MTVFFDRYLACYSPWRRLALSTRSIEKQNDPYQLSDQPGISTSLFTSIAQLSLKKFKAKRVIANYLSFRSTWKILRFLLGVFSDPQSRHVTNESINISTRWVNFTWVSGYNASETNERLELSKGFLLLTDKSLKARKISAGRWARIKLD